MKKLITLGLVLGSLTASAQSYLVLGNGVTLTTDKAGFVYDYGHFVLPYEIVVKGGNFFVEKKKLNTIDEAGFRYEKDEKIEKIKGNGLNYVLTNDQKLITVDSKGFYYKFEKEDVLKRVEKFGGNFFLAKDQKKKATLLYTVNSAGSFINIDVPGLNPADISVLGGNYFITSSGVTYTVSSEGFVFSKTEKLGTPKKLGGNFVIDFHGRILTVSDAGFLVVPSIPKGFSTANISKIGANYMLDTEGRMFVVDKNGNIFERFIKDHDLRNVRVLSM